MKIWAKNIKSPTSKRKEAQDALEKHQLALEDMEVTQDLLNLEAELQKAYQKSCREEEEYRRQKSRSIWLQVGDKNTSYFHKQEEANKHYKAVSKI